MSFEGGAGTEAIPRLPYRPPVGDPSVVLGRHAERKRLHGLLSAARRGLSSILFVQGEAGIGKSTLLREVIASATGFRVLSISAVESEMSLGFAALHRILHPVLSVTEKIPPPQRRAIETAFGLDDGPPDRFLLGLGTLTLLASVGAAQPVLCVVDDAQWADGESMEVLGFVGRRLHAEGIVLLFAMRADLDGLPAPPDGVDTMRLGGLDEPDARELLLAEVSGRIEDRVARRLIDEAHGSPLAIIEMARKLSEGQLIGSEPLGDVLSIGTRLEAHFLQRVRALPPAAQSLLLVAACDTTGDPATLWRVGSVLGFGITAADEGERSGLVRIWPRVEFRHPLVRSALRSGAPVVELRRAHQALADATDAVTERDRRAWHRAAATDAPNEDVASELEECAEIARRRGGYMGEAAFRSRAAELSTDVDRRTDRLLAAAEAHLTAGELKKARALLDGADAILEGRAQHAQSLRLHAGLRALSRPADVPALLLQSARTIAPLDPGGARERAGEALNALAVSFQLTRGLTPIDVADEVLRLRGAANEEGPVIDRLVEASARRLCDGYVAAFPLFRRTVDRLAPARAPLDGLDRWVGILNWLVRELWDDRIMPSVLRRIEADQRTAGALDTLPVTLEGLAHFELWRGRLAEADALHSEAKSIAVASGGSPSTWELLKVELRAWQGDDDQVQAMARILTSDSFRRSGAGAPYNTARMALTIVAIAESKYRPALDLALELFKVDSPSNGNQAIPEVIEAAVRCGEKGVGAAALDRLTERAMTAATPWALGVLARCRAMMEVGPVDAQYEEAIAWLSQCDMGVDLARAHLLFGEWLRTQNRKAQARDHLRAAGEMFSRFGAVAFARRARSELLAAGGRLVKATAETARLDLTPQEAQIARLAAAGATNADIAAQIFLSAATVDYHLRKVFRKLGITSRRHLATRLSRLPPET